MPDSSPKPDRFKPAMPAIPGVPAPAPAKQAKAGAEKPARVPPWADRKVQIIAGVVVAFVLFLAVILPQLLRKEPPPAPIVLDNPAPAAAGASQSGAQPASNLPVAPGPVATPQDLAKPWSSLKFLYQQATGERVPAMVVRLPSGSGASAYWGFLTVAPYGQCEMTLEEDIGKIAQDYRYRARHPMIVDSCTQTVYDPLNYGSTGGVLVRGRVVAGTGIRPPLMVEIALENGNVVAKRSE